MRKISVVLLLFVLLTGCSSKKELTVVKPYDETNHINQGDFVYALPQTVLNISVEATETVFVPGPYAKYAKKYLGIDNVISDGQTNHKISEINIETVLETDPKSYYVLSPGDDVCVDYLQLSRMGMVLPINFEVPENKTLFFASDKLDNEQRLYTDVTNSEYFAEVDRPVYRTVRRDSGYARVPVMKSQFVQKSVEDKAEEAARFIFEIRQSRMNLITYESELVFDGKAVKTSVDEFNRLEQEYLTLFTGKKFERNYTKTFYYTPEKSNISKPNIVFRFSEANGVVEAKDLSGRPIYLEMNAENKTAALNDFFQKQEKDRQMQLENKKADEIEDIPLVYYRIPDVVNLKIIDGRKLLAKDRISICQFGDLLHMPASFILKENNGIKYKRRSILKKD